MIEHVETVVVGSGVAGIAAAIGHGPGALVLEKRNVTGGLSSSVELDGTIFDIGGHSFHTPHPQVKDLVYEHCQMFEQVRVARCYSHGELIAYPFQKNFASLSREDVVDDCQRGLAAINGHASLDTLDDYLRTKFGDGICNHFLIPYNQKLWGSDLKRIYPNWVKERIFSGSLPESPYMKRGAREPLNEATIVAYPAKGGFGEIVSALARRVPQIRFNVNIAKIDVHRQLLHSTCGSTIRWQRLISTMPLDRLLRLIEQTPAQLSADTDKLEVLSMALLMVVLQGQLETDVQRIYCADESTPAHKIVFNNNSSDYLRSLPNHGILGEVSLANGKHNAAHLERSFVESLVKIGVLPNLERVRTISTVVLDYGYPVTTKDSRRIVATAKEWLHSHGIYSVGRFGEHDYINSDEALLRGLVLGRKLGGERCLSM